MGALLSSAFIPPDSLLGCSESEDGDVTCLDPFESADWYWGLVQALSLLGVYGYILFQASNMLSEGSELLLLVPQVAGLVGSVVLPILGAVPDGAIMLFSGLGEGAQKNLQVGVGALAGSTIMLLTVPWGLCTLVGSVPLDAQGRPNYAKRAKKSLSITTLSRHGIKPEATIRKNAYVMMATAVGYLVIQFPAWSYAMRPSTSEVESALAGEERWWAFGALIFSTLAFIVYLALMFHQSEGSAELQDKIHREITKVMTGSDHVSLSGLFGPIIAAAQGSSKSVDSRTSLRDNLLDADKQRLAKLITPIFNRYDVNHDGAISVVELCFLLKDLHEEATEKSAKMWMNRLDPQGHGKIVHADFVDAMLQYCMEKMDPNVHTSLNTPEIVTTTDDAAEEEDTEMPEEFQELEPDEQQRRIKLRACRLMALGTALVLIFSDPMVDVMSNVGERVKVPPFYVAFVLAPLASNASELIASVNYASKKSKKTITVALAALEGAACMNNTFCLAIFMGLIFFQNLAWKFTAETVAIVTIELIMAVFAVQRVHTATMGVCVLALFPISIVAIALLEGAGVD